MGTNYYLEHETVPARIHIGKSSYGWAFSLHIMPYGGINELEDWRKMWTQPGWLIVNEYGERKTPEEMEDVILNRGDGVYCNKGVELCHHTDVEYPSAYIHTPEDQRPRRGAGPTYDLAPYEFS